MDKRIIVVSLLLAACSPPPAPTPTAIISPTATSTATSLPPTATATATLEPTTVPLPELPEEFMAKFPNEEGYSIGDGKVVVDGEIWYELEDGQWMEKLWIYEALTSEEISAIEFEGSEDFWGVMGERFAGLDEEEASYVVEIRGKVVSLRRETLEGLSYYIADVATLIDGNQEVLPMMLGGGEEGRDIICRLPDGSNPEETGGMCNASIVIDNFLALGGVVKVEIIYTLLKGVFDYYNKDPDYEPTVGNTYISKYIYLHYEAYKSLVEKIISGDVASITPEEAELLLGVFQLDIE